MTAWLLSLIGIAFLGVLVDLVLPSGQMNKYIKGMFGIFTVFVIISPLPKLLNIDIDFNSLIYNQSATEIDSDFLQATNQKIKKQLEISVEKNLENKGFLKVDVEILANLEDMKFTIKKVIVNLQNMVINGNLPHINKYTEIKAGVLEILNIEEGQVVFNE